MLHGRSRQCQSASNQLGLTDLPPVHKTRASCLNLHGSQSVPHCAATKQSLQHRNVSAPLLLLLLVVVVVLLLLLVVVVVARSNREGPPQQPLLLLAQLPLHMVPTAAVRMMTHFHDMWLHTCCFASLCGAVVWLLL
jgi:hypothetical protein